MKPNNDLTCDKISWQGREAYVLGNDLVRLVSLGGGGHIAEFCFAKSTGFSTLNPMWVPPWKTIEPYRYRPEVHASRYGPPDSGKLISGIVGHNLCLDYFGVPSEEEAKQGLSVHGEAPSARWRKTDLRVARQRIALTLAVRLPVAGLQFSRELQLRRGESVAYFKETVVNENKADHFFSWQQHVTLGPPFLSSQDCRVAISATKGKVFPHEYDEGKGLLEAGREFRWPMAPARGGGTADLTHPLARQGSGILATVLLDPRRDTEFVAALNTRARLLIAHCFSRHDYPWVAIWEENQARTAAPWSGKTQSRGLEFGSTPFPVSRREAFALGPLFGTPTLASVPARGRKTVRYVAFLAQVPEGFGNVRDIRPAKNEILVIGSESKEPVRVPASGLGEAGLI
jgi:hypothetical protein